MPNIKRTWLKMEKRRTIENEKAVRPKGTKNYLPTSNDTKQRGRLLFNLYR